MLPGLTQLQQEEAARIAANTVTNLPPGVHMYSGLQPIDGVVQQTKCVWPPTIGGFVKRAPPCMVPHPIWLQLKLSSGSSSSN